MDVNLAVNLLLQATSKETGHEMLPQRDSAMLIRSHRQESLSRAYIQAIAARSGLNCAFREFDYGIDVTVHHIQRRENRYIETGFNLDIQAKSTVNVELDATNVIYDMEAKTFNDLCDANVGTPRILVLLIQPVTESEWTSVSEDELLLRRCAYWLSIAGQEPTFNRQSVRVRIPRANRFSPEALNQMMARVRNGEDL